MASGLKPITDNPVELALLKGREMDRYIFGQKIFQEMKAAGLAKFVRFGSRAPDGWVKINDKIAKVYFKADSGEGMIQAGEFYAPEQAATLINNHLSPGLQGNTAYQMARHAGLALNSAQLGLSAFHLGFTTIDAVVSKAALGIKQLSRGDILQGTQSLAMATLGGPAQPFINAYRGNRLINAYLGRSNDPGLVPIVEAMKQANARIGLDDFYRNASVNAFRQAIRQGQYLRAIPRALGTALDMINKPIFEYLVPRQKLGVFYDMARDWLESHPDSTMQEQRVAMGKMWDSVDNRMGQLVYDNLFWNRALKDSLMIGVRSVGWNLGTMRELGGGAMDAFNVKDIARNKALSDRTAYLIALPMMTAILGSVIHYLYTGQPPESIKDAMFPRTGRTRADGTEDRLSLPTYIKDIYEYSHSPLKTLGNKLHPLLGMIAQMSENEDFYGRAIVSPADPFLQKLADGATYVANQIEPFGVRNYMQQSKTNEQAPNPLGYVTSPSFFGFTPSPGYITKTPEETQSNEIRAQLPQLVSKFREAIRDGDDPAEVAERARNAGLTPQEVRQVLSSNRPRLPQPLRHRAD